MEYSYSSYFKKLREKYNQPFSSIYDHTLQAYSQPVAYWIGVISIKGCQVNKLQPAQGKTG